MTAPMAPPVSLRAGKPPTPAGPGGRLNLAASGDAARHRMEVSLDGKAPQDQAQYVDHAPTPDVVCGACKNFLEPSSCKLVAGPISRTGTCALFDPENEATEPTPDNETAEPPTTLAP